MGKVDEEAVNITEYEEWLKEHPGGTISEYIKEKGFKSA